MEKYILPLDQLVQNKSLIVYLQKKRMKQKIKTAIEFTKNLLITGAFKETSRRVEIEICRNIPKDENLTIVEYGMGHGNITKEILSRMSPSSKLYTFEVNEQFCQHVEETLIDERLVIINDGAQNVKDHVTSPVDAIVASIPYTFFSEDLRKQIMEDSYELLSSERFYSQILYTRFHLKKFREVFDRCERKMLLNFPPEYIYHCYKD